jgi:hypothetical protein
VLELFDPALERFQRPLLSFKASEFGGAERERLAEMLTRRAWQPQVYLHNWAELELERRMLDVVTTVWTGNLEVRAAVEPLHGDVRSAWTPGLLVDERRILAADVTVFSFGMAHKIQTHLFERLRELLERIDGSYAVFVSSANHETASIREAQAVYEEMRELFPAGLYFMGNLSDLAVLDELRKTTFFASFFPRGVRANNTSVAAAMEHGAVVITNLDEYSPPHLRHMENVIDINEATELPRDPLVLKRISIAAMEAARAHSWERLALVMSTPAADVPNALGHDR